jgi:hypothetical protein
VLVICLAGLVASLLFHFLCPHYPIRQYPRYCNLTHSRPRYPTSSPRDVLLLSADLYSAGLELTLKSLRSTGSQCRAILLVTDSFLLPTLLRPLFTELDLEINHAPLDLRNRPNVAHLLRYEAEHAWLTNHSHEIDRVLHADAFDVFFQRDPFSASIFRDELTFVAEPQLIKSCGWNRAWIANCYNETVSSMIGRHFILCSGSIIGGLSPYIAFLRLMVGQPEWEKCWAASMDQAMLNYLVRSGKVSEAGIRYRIVGCESDFFTMAWCVVDRRIDFNGGGEMVSRGGHVPAFVHQYNRFDALYLRWSRMCRVLPRDEGVAD